MELLGIARFSVSYDEWKAVYDGDAELRKQFMKDDIVGKVDEHTAMIKATITDSEKMDEIMSVRIPELEYMNLQHEFYSMQLMED
jgi:hypothetical protein